MLNYKCKIMYKIRILHYVKSRSGISRMYETKVECYSYDDAVSKFLFYVHAALENVVSIRCVNLIQGKKTIKLFQNH